MFGLDPIKTIYTIKGMPGYFNDLRLLRRQQASSIKPFRFGRPCPILGEKSLEGGSASGQYFHQDLLVARRIFENKPVSHRDVGSRIDGFIAHVASFRPIEVIDIRPVSHKVYNINFRQADMMKPIEGALIESTDSLSCLHTLEHFGLGRYGDPVNYDGYLLGSENLYRMLRKGGTLYFSVPIGPQRIEFNAHRVFSVSYLLDLFRQKYRINQFSFVDDEGNLHENEPLTESRVNDNFGCFHGCGIFEMTKL